MNIIPQTGVTGGDALVETLCAHGVDTAFTVSGESFLYVLDAMRRRPDRIRLLATRHEGGAAFAAEAFGKIAGRPAAVLVSRGPGASNAAIGVHTARQDCTPMLLFIGQVRTRSRGREAFQEIDHRRMFASLAKAVLEPRDAASIADVTAEAVALSMAGRPGPVVVALPRDLTEARLEQLAAPDRRLRPGRMPDPAAMAKAAEMIGKARRPLIVAGELVAQQAASAALAAFAEATGAPVMAAYRRQDVMDNRHPAYAGHLEINRMPFQREAFAAADLIVAVGSRLDGITTEDGTLIRPDQESIQIYPDAAVLARSGCTLPIFGDVAPTLAELTSPTPPTSADRVALRDELHAAFLDFSSPDSFSASGAVDLAKALADLQSVQPADTVIVTDGGSFARWVHRFYRFTAPHSQAGPMSGAMGYAVPGAIGATLARPGATAVAFVGDGGFMMSGQEMVTAVEHGLPIKVIVCDNGAHGSILAGQIGAFGVDADYGTVLASPDFAAVARAYGAAAWRIERTDEFLPALREALEYDGPALLHLITDRRDIAPFGAGKDAV